MFCKCTRRNSFASSKYVTRYTIGKYNKEQIFTNIFRWGGNPLASSKWISHLSFVRQHSPTEALDQSCFLPSATTLLYFRQSNHPHAFACSIFLHTVFNKQRKSCLRKQFGQPTKLSRGLIAVLYFFFLSKSRNIVPPRHESANTKNQIKMNMIAYAPDSAGKNYTASGKKLVENTKTLQYSKSRPFAAPPDLSK